MPSFESHNPSQTESLGESWGSAAPSGLVIGLCGDLGAGKTQLVKGLARGLSVPVPVHSPSFALLNIYEGGRLTLFHLDLYRLETVEQISAAGLEEYLESDGVTVIEWAERWFGRLSAANPAGKIAIQPRVPLPAQLRWVEIEALDTTSRRIAYADISS